MNQPISKSAPPPGRRRVVEETKGRKGRKRQKGLRAQLVAPYHLAQFVSWKLVKAGNGRRSDLVSYCSGGTQFSRAVIAGWLGWQGEKRRRRFALPPHSKTFGATSRNFGGESDELR
jgi:hypothetical protein